MLLLLVERDLVLQLDERAVDPGPDESELPPLRHFLPVLALPSLDDRCEDLEPLTLPGGEEVIDHLLDGLAPDRTAAVDAVLDADPGEEEAQVVVDLGDRGDGRPGIAPRRPLLDRDGRREPLDLVHVRLLHLPEELAGVGGEGFDVPPLALGVEGVEGERGLAGAGDAGQDDEGVPGDVEVQVLEVVLARAANSDLVHGSPES